MEANLLCSILVTAMIGYCTASEIGNSILSSNQNPFCWKFECCNSDWILRDIKALGNDLSLHLYGQHLVQDAVLKSIHGHKEYNSNRPLVFSFHGSTGMGKSFVSRLIASSWFRLGMDSSYVHMRIGTKDFPFKDKIREYKDQLEILIRMNTMICEHQLFIFDEVDSFPTGLLDALIPYLKTYNKIGGVDYRKCIFILISNTGYKSINNITISGFQRGLERESLSLKEMEEVMTDEIYLSENAGLSQSKLIEKFSVSYFLPFLPLERKHVWRCVERTIKSRMAVPFSTDLVERVMSQLFFYGPQDNFSVKGCKNVEEKVNYILVDEFYMDPSRTEL